jgi:Protein of unknown function (DUF2892)
MKQNEGTMDRALRGAAAVVAVVVSIAVGPGSVAGIILLAVAAVMGVTALSGFCPVYRLLGVSTCPLPSASAGRGSAR